MILSETSNRAYSAISFPMGYMKRIQPALIMLLWPIDLYLQNSIEQRIINNVRSVKLTDFQMTLYWN